MQFGIWRRPRVVAGRVYVIKDLGIIRITAVEKVDLSRLTPWEAEAAGARDVAELKQWLGEELPDTDTASGEAYRVRFRYLGPEEEEVAEKGGAEEDEEAVTDAESATPIPMRPVPPDLIDWLDKKDWRLEHLKAMSSGVWRNAEDISRELSVDEATTRRRMGDLRKRGLVTSHRHHGYRVTPEGRGAIQREVAEGDGMAGTSTAKWLTAKASRMELTDHLLDGRWHNASELGERMGLSVVSVQRRVAALRDRGIVKSHRRRGYRLTKAGFEALDLTPEEAKGHMGPADEGAGPGDGPVRVAGPDKGAVPTEEEAGEPPHEEEEAPPPIPSSLLEWLESRSYRKELLFAIPLEDYISSGEMSDVLSTSVTTLHGRLRTLKDRGLVESLPRRGYRLTPMGSRVVEILRAMVMKERGEPVGAEAFLSAESPGWMSATPTAGAVDLDKEGAVQEQRRPRWGVGDVCGFCGSSPNNPAKEGWIETMQNHLEHPGGTNGGAEPIRCRRGIFEDPSWFLVVERDPLAEGHCKLISKEHVWDLYEMSMWVDRDQKLAMARDTMARDLTVAVEVIMAMDAHIVDVMVILGLEHGSHLHFDLIPRYRMDLPGLRPLASSRAHYDDLSLVRKRRLWRTRCQHFEEVAARLRKSAKQVLERKGHSSVRVTRP